MSYRERLSELQGIVLADKYRLVRLLGAGGMGYVYQAEHLGLGRSVAIKLLRAEANRSGIARFREEARAASRINHPHAVAIYDFGVADGDLPYLVMEHLRGRTLAERLEEETPSIDTVVEIGAQVLSALAEAHACGVVHCDLSADNIIVETMRSGEEFAKVIDFGLARWLGAPTGGIAGTVEYMAPEQVRGEEVGAASDLYAVGVLLYEMVVGRTPFAGASVPVIVNGHLHAAPTPPHEVVPTCPRSLSSVILHALRKDPAERPANAGALRDALLGAVPARATGSDTDRRRPSTLRRALAAGTTELPPPRSGPRLPRRSTRLSARPEPGATPFVGRDAELERFVELCRSKHPVVRISGPSGTGRSRLALEGAGRLTPDFVTYVTAADPSGVTAPWFPILSLLRDVLGLGSQPTLPELENALAVAGLPARDLPGLAELLDLEGPARELEPPVRQREARAAALRALTSVSRRFRRTIFVFADADRYDERSRELMTALAEVAFRSRLRIVYTTANPTDALPFDAEIALAGLSPAASLSLTRELAGDAPASTEVIYGLTSGIPAAIEQVAGWLRDGNPLAAAPSLLVDLISVRIHRLTPDDRRLLQAVAVHGAVAPPWLVQATLGTDAPLEVDEIALGGLLVVGQELTLASPLVASIVDACTPVDIRRELHRNALRALDGRAPAGVLGFHAREAGDLDRARADLVTAARDAARRFDASGSARWYGRALDVARRLRDRSELDADAFLDIATATAEQLVASGQVALARGLIAELEAQRPGRRLRLDRLLARLSIVDQHPEAALEHLRRAIGEAIVRGETDLLVGLYLDLAGVLLDSGRFDEAIDELEQGIDLVSQGEGLRAGAARGPLWELGFELAEHLLRAGRVSAAAEAAAGALVAAERVGSKRGRGRVAALLARIHDITGNATAAAAHRSLAIELLGSLGDRRSTAELLLDSAHRPLRPGDAVDAEAVPLARELATEIGWTRGVRRSLTIARGDRSDPDRDRNL